MSEELLRRLALEELAGQQDRLGNHDRLDGSRLLNPHLPGVLMRGGLHELHLEAQQAGHSYKVRPTVILPSLLQQYFSLSQNPGQGPGWTSSFTTWANAADHTQTFDMWYNINAPYIARIGQHLPYSWNQNLFCSFYRGLSAILPAPYVALDRSITITSKINLLDATGAVLTTATCVLTEHDTYPPQANPGMQENFTAGVTLTMGTEQVPAFNAIQATISTDPACPQGAWPIPSPPVPPQGYFNAASVVAILYWLPYTPLIQVAAA